MIASRFTRARGAVAALAALVALAACQEVPTSPALSPAFELPNAAAGCDGRRCILFNSTAPLNSAMYYADSSSAPVLLGSATLSGSAGDSLMLRLDGEAQTLASLPADEQLTIDIDGVPRTVALRDVAAGVLAHRFTDARPVMVRYSINRRVQRALRGTIVLAQESRARVADLRTPWVATDDLGGARRDLAPTDPLCQSLMNVSENTTYCGVTVFIQPWASADAFTEHGATFQSDPGHGQSHEIVISFSEPVEKVEVTAHDVTWGGDRFTAYDTAGYILGDKIYAANNQPGVYSSDVATAAASPINGAGIATIKLTAVEGEYIAYSMKVQFKKNNGCKVDVTSMGQGDLPWRDTLLDHSKTITIQRKGCALTSLAMGITGNHIASNPLSLNTTLKATPGAFDPKGGVGLMWDVDVAAGSGSKLHYVQLSSEAAMKKEICAGYPVVVGVKLDGKNNPGHFVLVNEVKADGTFWITDPGHGSGVVADLKKAYPTGYVLRGSIKPARSGVTASARIGTSSARRLLSEIEDVDPIVVMAQNSAVTVTDDAGASSSTGGSVGPRQDIVGSSAFTDRFDDDDSPFELGTSENSMVRVPGVAGSHYTVQITPSVTARDSTLLVMARGDGSAMPTKWFAYNGVAGMPVLFEVSLTAGVLDAAPLITGGVDITASCGLSHQVRNTNDVDLDATYLVEETGETGAILLPARPAGKLYSRTKLDVTTHGTLSISYHGRVIGRAPAPPGCS